MRHVFVATLGAVLALNSPCAAMQTHGAVPQPAAPQAADPAISDFPPHIQEQIRNARHERARNLGYIIEPGVTYREIVLPRPISALELERYASILDLSAAPIGCADRPGRVRLAGPV